MKELTTKTFRREKTLRHCLRNAETIDLDAYSSWTGREAKSKEKSKEKGKEKSVEKILKHLYASVGTIGQQVADQLGIVSQGIAQIVQQDAEQLRSPFEPKHRQRRKNRNSPNGEVAESARCWMPIRCRLQTRVIENRYSSLTPSLG